MRIYFTCFLFLLSLQLSAQTERNTTNLQLVWEDNFDSLNTDIWKVQNHFDHYGNELQVYTSRPENVFIEDGSLVLRVDREDYSCPTGALNPWGCSRQLTTGEPYEFTSGWIETKEAYNTEYGYAEARIYLPYGQGFWPAFWTFTGEGVPNNVNAGEIDIFEMYGHKAPNLQSTNVHLAYCNENHPTYPECNDIGSYGQVHFIPNYAFKYLIYAVEWTPDIIRWKTNDQVIRVIANPGVVDPLRLIINMAILQDNPPYPGTIFPADTKIDYVRVYEHEVVSNTDDFLISEYDFALFPNPVSTNRLNIKSIGNQNITKIKVMNSIGQLISSEQVDSREFSLDISSFSNANYFVQIFTKDGMITKPFLKQ